jgi:hypothetical protein
MSFVAYYVALAARGTDEHMPLVLHEARTFAQRRETLLVVVVVVVVVVN